MATLTSRQMERFCQEYVIDYNGTQAAVRAGYSGKRAAAQASVLLKREDVIARVGELQAEQTRRLGLTADRVILELMTVYSRCMQAEPVMTWNYETKEFEESGEYKFDARGAVKALELIGRHLGMFAQKVQVSGNEDDKKRLGELLGELGMSGK